MTNHRTSQQNSIDIWERLPLYGPLDIKDKKHYYEKSKRKFAVLFHKPCPYMTNRDDFETVGLLGEGAFGIVILVKNKQTQEYLAMKALEKKHIVSMNQVAHALNEKRILQGIDFPFSVRMEHFCKDNSYIYFFLPYISGGELYTHLQRLGKFSESTARFYAAQVVLGLEYLHYLHLVYRDLKPENLLVDHLGYIKITDFGFTKPVKTRTYTFCGTPHYLAPEIIAGHGYGPAVDWWSTGVLIYELNAGFPPFEARDQLKMFRLILTNRYSFPNFFSSALKDIVTKLLQVDVTKRYGILKSGVSDIKYHDWFKTVDWAGMLNRRLEPPLIPAIDGQGDVSHFPSAKGGDFRRTIKVSSVNEFDKEFKDF